MTRQKDDEASSTPAGGSADGFAALIQVTARNLEEYFANCRKSQGRTLPAGSPEDLIALARTTLATPEKAAAADGHGDAKPRTVEERFGELTATVLSYSHRLHDPRYMGHQVPAAVPAAALFDLLGRATSQGAAVFEMAPFGTAAEKAIIRELGALIGWAEGTFAGIGTHGGTLANVTALLAARNLRFGESWQKGLATDGRKPAILTSADSHYCIARACGILGIGTEQLLKVPVDKKRRMDISKAREVIDGALRNGLEPFAIVGSACTTPTGSFDDLAGIAALAREFNLWFHVDGAHGASFLFSKRHRHLLDGIEEADSIAWDAHKMLFVPALCTYLLYKNREHSWAPFAQDAPYLFDPADPSGMAEYDGGLRTFECTKGSISLGLWGIWSLYGRDFIASLIDGVMNQTRIFYQMIEAAADFEPAHDPQCNILCFRHVPQGRSWGEGELSNLQQRIRAKLLNDGNWYITGTKLDGNYWLRVTIINPLTAKEQFTGLLNAIRECMIAV